MKVINLFGGPNSGKSTTAAELFAEMKKAGMAVELVTEYAKDMVWEQRHNILGEQQYIFAKQQRRLTRLRGQVEWAITDSPLLFCAVYAHGDEPQSFFTNVVESFHQFENINIFFPRNPKFVFHREGRTQAESELEGLDAEIIHILPPQTKWLDVKTGDYAGQIIRHLELPVVRDIDVMQLALEAAIQGQTQSDDPVALQENLNRLLAAAQADYRRIKGITNHAD